MWTAIFASGVTACSMIAAPLQDNKPAPDAIFAPGIVSTDQLEYAITFTPDCKTVYFSRRTGDWGADNNSEPVLMESHWREGRWSPPVNVAFSGDYGADDPFVTADGRYLYFTSTRAKTPDGKKADYDIWRVERQGASWSAPERLPEPVNSSHTELSPFVTSSGALYFASDRPGGLGQGDIYVSKPDNAGGYDITPLPNSVNSPMGEWNVGLDANETMLIFEASHRPTNLSAYGDFYVSYRNGEAWSKAVPLVKINTTGSNLFARFSPDNAYIFYGSSETLESRDVNIRYARMQNVMPAVGAVEFLAVANRSEHVISLVDSVTYNVVAKIPSGKGAHEVATIDRIGFVTASYGVYNDVSNKMKTPRRLKFKFEESDGVVSYNAKSKRQTSIPLKQCVRPHGVETAPDGTRFWVTCEEERAIAEINAATGDEIARWQTNQAGSHIVVYDANRDRLYVANVDAGSVSVIDRKVGTVKVIKTARGAEGLAITNDGAALWVANAQANSISVIDLEADRVVRTFRSGGRFPVKIRMAPNGKDVWVAHNNSRELSVYNVTTMEKTATIPLESAPLGLLISPSGDRVFVTLPRLDRIDVFDGVTRKQITSFSPGTEPDGMAWVFVE